MSAAAEILPIRTVAALYVEPRGPYSKIDGIDLWDAKRDARLYRGPYPVVAHPPCARWCRLAGLVEARWGHKRGEDGGTFEAALKAVRTWGGVLEHPAYSDAWNVFDLPTPPWVGWQRGLCGGWSCHVAQGRYGHAAKKPTWLYAFGVPMAALPQLSWGREADQRSTALVSWCGNHTKSRQTNRYGEYARLRDRVGKKAAQHTPDEFRDILVAMARMVDFGACGLVPWVSEPAATT